MSGVGSTVSIQFFDIIMPLNYFCSFQILITGGSSGLVETITDAVSIHSIKKTLYAKRLTEGRFGQVTLLDHFINVSDTRMKPATKLTIAHLLSLLVILHLRNLLALRGISLGHSLVRV